ncbi:transcriptional repressor [Alsobacter sp. KACC 23698]|uniref:Transcriptional repressor n=1 Tax=Alsobacter sp. KACC 23698 TaxID=3149229 RepID=A0AAU7JDC0_9HYPH
MAEHALPRAGHHHEHAHHPGEGGCAHAQDHAARGPAALAEAESACAARGLRLTPIRRQVLNALYATHRPMSAYDLIDRLAAEGGAKRLAPITVYRALDFLLENGFVHKLESRNAFIACPFHHAPGDLVVFMICEECGGVDEAVSDELRGALSHLAAAQGFRPSANVIELAGCCAHCGEPAHAPPAGRA